MTKLHLNNKLQAEHKSDNSVLMEKPEARTVKEVRQNERIKKQFAQDDLIYQRVKRPVMAMACCLIHQV